ncbi:DNA (cytosine-5-)-methyltransferase [Paraburkholderia sp. UCT31]|uniref:DNA (cytosine-5-)-methyltransferase n=1 Tax=Paraburkholderia sp. UCT31 TaxID=2615209 RepID=UPI00165596FB|nr:DNA (cytosine-5-)-methyltransferase [Paraburkholderia sp. UCT31]MBC8738548.1 DNA (cytosine-5-)-methyltransferase [Paraburkholderia sp. UCT31]
MSRENFSFIDLFAGIGGIRRAFESIGGACVFTSEWDKFARQTYAANYGLPIDDIAGDIWAVKLETIPDHDVLVGGFPCQPFSLAGVSKKNAMGRVHGFACDAQGTLFFRLAEVIKEKRPAAFMLENVKNLVSHNKGHTFRVIRHVLENELGYHISYKVIDARRWSPQHRERIYIVGFRDDVGFEWPDESEWPAPGGARMNSVLQTPEEVAPKYTLTPKLWAYLQAYREKHQKAGNGFGCSVVTAADTCRTLSARYRKDGSEILIDQGPGKIPRRLTPRECSRLMGFGDDFILPVSDTQLYRQFGNSVSVPAVKAVASAMLPYLTKALATGRASGKAASDDKPVIVLKGSKEVERHAVDIPNVD